MGGALAAAMVLVGAVLAVYGTGQEALRIGLGVSARWSFLLFWLAYSAGPIDKLFRPGLTALARRGRSFGLAFASAHLVHVALIIWLGLLINGLPLGGRRALFFGVGLFFTYLLAMLSFGLAKGLNPVLWRGLMFVGMNYILVAFARDFVHGALYIHQPAWRVLDYSVFASLCLGAPLLRIAASLRARGAVRPVAVRP
jgi:hypothetical protein